MNVNTDGKRILIVEAEYGGGHKSITEAVTNYLKKLSDNQIEIQTFNFANRWISKGYQWIETNNDWAYSLGYALIDRPILSKWEPLSMVNFFLKKKSLLETLNSFQPNVVFINNQFAIQRIPELISQYFPNMKSVVFVPDPFTASAMAFNPQADKTLVATKVAYKKALKLRIEKKRLIVSGHPVREAFYDLPKSKDAHRKLLGLNPNLLTVLLGGSGDGADKVLPIIKGLANYPGSLPKFQAVVVTGNNAGLKKELDALPKYDNFILQVRGYERNMPAVMHAADLAVGKAGPNLILEAIASKIPFLATYYLSQEKGNVDYIVENNLGGVALKPEQAVEWIAEVVDDPKKLQVFQPSIEKERQVHRWAAKNIAKEILKMI